MSGQSRQKRRGGGRVFYIFSNGSLYRAQVADRVTQRVIEQMKMQSTQ